MKKILITLCCLFSISIFSQNAEIAPALNEIVPSQGFSLSSLWRGVLGMVALILIAFLYEITESKLCLRFILVSLVTNVFRATFVNSFTTSDALELVLEIVSEKLIDCCILTIKLSLRKYFRNHNFFKTKCLV